MDNNGFFKSLEDLVIGLGAYRASVIPVTAVETDESFRRLCEQNVCGNYGKNWACPMLELSISPKNTYADDWLRRCYI